VKTLITAITAMISKPWRRSVRAFVSGSLVLLAFGLDRVIELISAGVLMWRRSVELRHGCVFSENAERIAGRIGGALLFALAAYVGLTVRCRPIGFLGRHAVIAAGWPQ
jgi:hypothetical protein